MRYKKLSALFLLLILSVTALCWRYSKGRQDDDNFISYTVDLKKQAVKMYLKDNTGKRIGSIGNLKDLLLADNSGLLFAMNGGMYMENHFPLGLYIENGETKTRLNKSSGSGNFYMMPNGVFYLLKDNTAHIASTPDFSPTKNIQYATQSGPMLVISEQINSAFKEGSANLNIRNGVGILPDGKVVFAMSKIGVSFYEFAAYFKKLGCKDALYLDGFVSRTYYPEKSWIQTDGDFGVIIGVTQK